MSKKSSSKRPPAAQVAFAEKAAKAKADNAEKVKATALISTPGLQLGATDEAAAAGPVREHDHVHAPRGPPRVQVTAARTRAAGLLTTPGTVRLLDKHEVCAIAGVTYPTIWSWMRVEAFPRSRVVGGKSMWLSTEVDAWLAALPVRKLQGDAPLEVAE